MLIFFLYFAVLWYIQLIQNHAMLQKSSYCLLLMLNLCHKGKVPLCVSLWYVTSGM